MWVFKLPDLDQGFAGAWLVNPGEERSNPMNENLELLPLANPEAGEDLEGVKLRKRIALVAHDNKKQDLLEWALYNRELLVQHDLYATGTTGRLLSEILDTPVVCLQSGPLGGDQQIGARIAQGEIDLLVFFWDPLSPLPHDPDIKALLRIAVVWNLPVACDRATADYVISSPLMTQPYARQMPDYGTYIERFEVEKQNLVHPGA
jgi:methylglyoxal synthase